MANTTHPDYLSDRHVTIWRQLIEESFSGLRTGDRVFQISGASLDAYDEAGGTIPSETAAPSETSAPSGTATGTASPPMAATNPSKGKERAVPRLPLPKTTAAVTKAPGGKKPKTGQRKVWIKDTEPQAPTILPPTALRSGKEVPHIPMDDDERDWLEQQDNDRTSEDSSDSEMDIDGDSDNMPLSKVKASRKRATGRAQTTNQSRVVEHITISSDDADPAGNDVITIRDTPPLDDPSAIIGQGGPLDAWSLIHPTVYGNNIHENPGADLKARAVSDVEMLYINQMTSNTSGI